MKDIKKMLKDLANSRTDIEKYIKDSLDKLNYVHSIDELHNEERFDDLLDKGIWIPDTEDKENCFTILGYEGNDLIIIEAGIGMDFDSVDKYPFRLLTITDLLNVAEDVSSFLED